MPEGPEIKRAADEIAKAIGHQIVTEIFFAFDHLKVFESVLQGQTIVAIQSKERRFSFASTINSVFIATINSMVNG